MYSPHLLKLFSELAKHCALAEGESKAVLIKYTSRMYSF